MPDPVEPDPDPKPSPSSWHLSDNGLAAVKEIAKVAMAIIGFLTILYQLDAESARIRNRQDEAEVRLKKIETKLDEAKPLYFGGKKP